RRLCRDREVSDEASLQGIRQNRRSFLVQLLQQTVVDSPRKSSGEALCQSRVPGLFSSQSLAMKEAGAGLLARQEYRSHLHALSTKSQGSNYATRICDATCSDYGHF